MSEWILSSCLLIVAVVILRKVLQGKLNLRLQYGLWALVLIRLLLPLSIGNSVLSVQNLQNLQNHRDFRPERAPVEVQMEMPSTQELPVPAIPQQEESKPSVSVEVPFLLDQMEAQGAVPQVGESEKTDIELPVTQINPIRPEITVEEKTWDWQLILKALWIAGIGACGAVLLLSNLRFAQKLRHQREILNLEGPLPVYLSKEIETPCLFGVISPAIYVTEEVLHNEQTLHHVLEHEYTHYLQKDHIWSLLRCVCLALHWYNPLVWLAAKLSKYDAELSCDEGTIRRIGEKQRIPYGQTLVGLTCLNNSAKHLMVAATTMSGSKKSLKERILLIAKRPSMTIYTLIAVILVAVLVVGCTFTGAVKDTFSIKVVENYNFNEQSNHQMASPNMYGDEIMMTVGNSGIAKETQLIDTEYGTAVQFKHLARNELIADENYYYWMDFRSDALMRLNKNSLEVEEIHELQDGVEFAVYRGYLTYDNGSLYWLEFGSDLTTEPDGTIIVDMNDRTWYDVMRYDCQLGTVEKVTRAYMDSAESFVSVDIDSKMKVINDWWAYPSVHDEGFIQLNAVNLESGEHFLLDLECNEEEMIHILSSNIYAVTDGEILAWTDWNGAHYCRRSDGKVVDITEEASGQIDFMGEENLIFAHNNDIFIYNFEEADIVYQTDTEDETHYAERFNMNEDRTKAVLIQWQGHEEEVRDRKVVILSYSGELTPITAEDGSILPLSEETLSKKQKELVRLVKMMDISGIQYEEDAWDEMQRQFIEWHLSDTNYFDSTQWENENGKLVIPVEVFEQIVEERTVWEAIELNELYTVLQYNQRQQTVSFENLGGYGGARAHGLLSIEEVDGKTTVVIGSYDMETFWAEPPIYTLLQTITAEFETNEKGSWRLLSLKKEIANTVVPYEPIGTKKEYADLSTPEDLLSLAKRVNSGDESYKDYIWQLTNDIDMTGYDWEPIGGKRIGQENCTFFDTQFHGNGYTVSGIDYVQNKDGKYENFAGVGFFGVLGQNASIQNLHVQGSFAGEAWVGGIAGIALTPSIESDGGYAKIRSCSFVGDVYGVEAVGGIMGASDSKTAIYGCFADVNAYGFYDVGGMVGVLSIGSCMEASSCTGTVTALNVKQIEEITGMNLYTYTNKDNFRDNIAHYIGGFVGGAYQQEYIMNCIADVKVSSNISAEQIHNFVGSYIEGKCSNNYCVAGNSSWTAAEGFDASLNSGIREISREQLADPSAYGNILFDFNFEEMWAMSEKYQMPIPLNCYLSVENEYGAYRPYMELLVESSFIYRDFSPNDMSMLSENAGLYKIMTLMGLEPDIQNINGWPVYYLRDKVEEAVQVHFDVDTDILRSHKMYDEELRAYCGLDGLGGGPTWWRITNVQQSDDTLVIQYEIYGGEYGHTVIRLEKDGGWKYVSNSYGVLPQENFTDNSELVKDAVLRFGANEYEIEGKTVIQVDSLSMYHNDRWTLASNTPSDMFAFFHGMKVMEGLSYEALSEKYSHPNVSGWFYPQDLYEQGIMNYFDVSALFLQSDRELYSADYKGYMMPQGGGVGFRPEIEIAEHYEYNGRVFIQLYLSTVDGGKEPYILCLQLNEGGYKYLSYLPGTLNEQRIVDDAYIESIVLNFGADINTEGRMEAQTISLFYDAVDISTMTAKEFYSWFLSFAQKNRGFVWPNNEDYIDAKRYESMVHRYWNTIDERLREAPYYVEGHGWYIMPEGVGRGEPHYISIVDWTLNEDMLYISLDVTTDSKGIQPMELTVQLTEDGYHYRTYLPRPEEQRISMQALEDEQGAVNPETVVVSMTVPQGLNVIQDSRFLNPRLFYAGEDCGWMSLYQNDDGRWMEPILKERPMQKVYNRYYMTGSENEAKYYVELGNYCIEIWLSNMQVSFDVRALVHELIMSMSIEENAVEPVYQHEIESMVQTFGAVTSPSPTGGESLFYANRGYSLYNQEYWDVSKAKAESYFTWLHSYIENNFTADERAEEFAHPLGENQGWFFPKDYYEMVVDLYFDVDADYLRTDTRHYDAELGGYSADTGPGIGDEQRITIDQWEQNGNIVSIDLTVGQRNMVLMTELQQEGGWHYLSYHEK